MNPTSEIAATGGGDDKAYIWKVADGSTLFELSGHTDSISSVKFNFDGKLLATSSFDCSVKIWEVQTGKLTSTLEGPSDPIDVL